MPSAPKPLHIGPAATSETRRENSHRRGYTRRWYKARAAFLASNPLCAECAKSGAVTAAFVLDHIVPHRGNQDLFWDQNNWQGLCEQDHNEKTARGE